MLLAFSTKAGTLAQLQGYLRSARIAPLVFFTVADWRANQAGCLARVQSALGCGPSIVRSSCQREDSANASYAGAFLSLPEVTAEGLTSAVDQVIAAYVDAGTADEVLIQPMLQGILRAGVAFSHDPNTCAPYRVVNWSEGEDTTTVTGGMGGRIWQQAAQSSISPPAELSGVVALLEELLTLFSGVPVDCEFAVTLEGATEVLWLLQARPLILFGTPESGTAQAARLESIQRKVARGMQPHPFLMGRRTVYGVMPDWNPAEMIGRRPKRLALSLYRELITDSIWAYQRDNYGYKSLRSFPLLVEIGGQPFIDTRVSFNSLLPKGLSGDLENLLVNYYLAKLSENRNLHDKVEFEIVLSSWTFDIDKRLSQLPSQISSLQKESLKETLTSLTRNVVLGNFVDSDINRVSKMIQRKKTISAEKGDILSELYWLLEDCKRWGTLPFAGLARAAFIATQVLKSLEVVTGKHDILAGFIAGLDTVTSQMSRDVYSLNKDSFLEKYGHLRPGTYDITSRSYLEAFDIYFGDLIRQEEGFEAKEDNHRNLESLLEESGIFEQLGVRAQEFLDFARRAVYWREQAKFEFTKNLSGVLDLIQTIGSSLEINREDLAFLDVRVLMNAYSSSFNLGQEFQKSIEKGKLDYHYASVIELPSLIRNESEILSFTEEDASPNFITSGSVAGVAKSKLENLSGHIALIEGADPGYDWIFQKGITGLITAYGGANSHMAVRCSELNLPAAIGVGDRLFKELKNAFHVNLDCGNRIIEYR